MAPPPILRKAAVHWVAENCRLCHATLPRTQSLWF